ncbi:hypothetical protein OHB21_20130 [Nocardia puris]|nr:MULTISPECIES: hypothetical protein [Nocardia]
MSIVTEDKEVGCFSWRPDDKCERLGGWSTLTFIDTIAGDCVARIGTNHVPPMSWDNYQLTGRHCVDRDIQLGWLNNLHAQYSSTSDTGISP